jgi:hypothetical protein
MPGGCGGSEPSPLTPTEAHAEQAVEIVGDARGIMAGDQARIDALGGQLLKSHVAVVARSEPRASETIILI